MQDDNEPKVRGSWPLALLRDDGIVFHVAGSNPPQYAEDAPLEALWRAGQKSRMYWHVSHRADPRALPLADRHYNRQKIGAPQFVPPGRCLVLLNEDATALWVTSWPYAQYVRHAWAGAWVCSLFRNESTVLSSTLIRQAVAATLWHYGAAPTLGFITFVDAGKTRRKRDPGRCYRKAGWSHVGYTAGGLVALQLRADQMPEATAPLSAQTTMQLLEAA